MRLRAAESSCGVRRKILKLHVTSHRELDSCNFRVARDSPVTLTTQMVRTSFESIQLLEAPYLSRPMTLV